MIRGTINTKEEKLAGRHLLKALEALDEMDTYKAIGMIAATVMTFCAEYEEQEEIRDFLLWHIKKIDFVQEGE